MKKSTKFSDILHILLHMAISKESITSKKLAKSMDTNAVVVRRTMAGLRERGLVSSEKGHGGGWQLSCDFKIVTLYDIYIAVDSPTLFAIGNRTDDTACLIEKAVNQTMQNAFEEAENLLIEKLRKITLVELQNNIAAYNHAYMMHGKIHTMITCEK